MRMGTHPKALRTMAAAVLAVVLAGCTVAVPDIGRIVDTLSGQPTPAASPSFDAQQAAVQQLIQKANQEQADAFNKNDATIMRDTTTAEHYQEMVQINNDLAAGGVTSIELLNISWGTITVSGTTAQATTFETWRSTYSDGSTDQSTDQNDYTLVLDGSNWLISANTQPGTGTISPGAGTPPGQSGQPVADAAPVRDVSSNWSGYAATGGTFTSVTGTWVVPQPAAASIGAEATWVGIGGVNTRDLIQAGTQTMVSNGSVHYEAWIEMLPDSSQSVALTVRPGDSVTATITERTAGAWLISIKNNTTSQTYSNTVTYNSSKSSAEWIEEAPSSGRSVVPLNDFGVITFTNGSTVKNGQNVTISGAGATSVTMINGTRQAIAQPSTLTSDGSSFSVTRTQAPSNATTPQRRRRGP
ncbi:MAG: hypothetical protein E6I87_01855 [Chloroflexi bacterium]|nr:MAG: hypothetical protein E6I87_01855 [Chloroflexota bacterium]